MSLANDIKSPFKSGNVLIQLIIINVAVFLFLTIVRISLFLSGYTGDLLMLKLGEFEQWIAMPMRFDWFVYKPWTIITYFFSHADIGHIFWNMLFLYFFGSILQSLIGYSRTLSIYVYGGLIGAILTLIAHSFIPVFVQHAGILIGASGSVMAIVLAAATLAPDYRVNLFILGEVKLIYIALFYVVIDMIGITAIDGVGHICHLGGALTGFIFIRALRSGTDFSKGFNRLFYGMTKMVKPGKRPKMKVVKNNFGKTNQKTAATGNSTNSKENVQKRIDAILDKISKGGYESLTKEEKDYLFTHGKDI